MSLESIHRAVLFERGRDMSRMPIVVFSSGLALLIGCSNASSQPAAPDNSGKGIFGKTTQEVGEFDANKANQVVSDQKIRASDPITAPLSAYGPIVEQGVKAQITYAIEIFRANNDGRYPKDHEEFMEQVIKANQIRLPVLPFKGRYMYDVEKHELVVVRDIENSEKSRQ